MRVLAVGAHPDDIEFGCGGALLHHVASGDIASLVVMSQGERGGDPFTRVEEQRRAAEFLGAELVMFDLPDGNLGSIYELVDMLGSVVSELAPDVVYTHLAADDIHQDHGAVHRATKIAARNVPSVLLYESPRSGILSSGIFVDISDAVSKKVELVNMHSSQVARNRNVGDEAIRARATLHGIRCGVPYAEAFQALRFGWRI